MRTDENREWAPEVPERLAPLSPDACAPARVEARRLR